MTVIETSATGFPAFLFTLNLYLFAKLLALTTIKKINKVFSRIRFWINKLRPIIYFLLTFSQIFKRFPEI